MGRRDGENEAPTEIGIAQPTVSTHPITTPNAGPYLAKSNTTASSAPETANANAVVTMEMLVQRAKVGRERGRESPMPVSLAMATRAGRNAPSTKLCTEISMAATPDAAPRIPYWTSRHPLAPAIAPTITMNTADQTASDPTPRVTVRRAYAYVASNTCSRSTGWPEAHCSTERRPFRPGRTSM